MSLTLPELAAKMRELDTCMLCTHADDGSMSTRPMSNNKQVSYDGSAWFFTWESSRMAQDITRNPDTLAVYQGGFGFWVAVQATTEIVTDKAVMAAHWDPDVERWFAEGIDTPGVVLLHVKARRITYWTFEDGDGEILV